MSNISAVQNHKPFVSVIVPMRNEADQVRASLESLARTRYMPVQFVIVDDRSTDDTATVVEAWLREHHDERFVLVRAPGEPPVGWVGKTFAVDFAIQKGHGEVLCIADADVRFLPEALEESVRLLGNASMLVRLPLVPIHNLGSILADFLLTVIWVASRVATMLGSLPLSFGACIFLTRQFYDSVGGFEAQRSFPESLPLARLAASRGAYRLMPPQPSVQAHLYDSFSAAARGTLRNINFSLVSPAAAVAAFVFIGFPVWMANAAYGAPLWAAAGLLAWCAAYATFARSCGRSWALSIVLGAVAPLGALVLAILSCGALVRRALGLSVAWRGRSMRVQ